MAIPDFQTLMRPILAIHEDGARHRTSEVREAMAQAFGLTPDEL